MPITKPTCASLKAVASFVPSPVTAIILPSCLSRNTNKNLSSGVACTITLNLLVIFLKIFTSFKVIFFIL